MPETTPNDPQIGRKPLEGKLILLTRPIEQSGPMNESLRQLGAETMLQPAISITEPSDWGGVDSIIEKIEDYDWLVFSSANGVRYLIERVLHLRGNLETLRRLRLAAIGPKTAEELAKLGLAADLTPDVYRAEALADALVDVGGGKRFLLARASRGREVLAERLAAAGGIVEPIVVYTSEDVQTANPEVERALAAGWIDWITVTSSAIARAVANLFGEELRKSKVASISPITSKTLMDLGFKPAVEATEYTTDGLISAIVDQETLNS